MVTAGGGASALTSSAYGCGGGVGGKLTRQRFSRNRAKPYDRPPTARRNPSLLSKHLVDPIGNLASSAATASLPLSPAKASRLPLPNRSLQAEARESLAVDGQNLTTADSGWISELEQLLKQKTFTRSEIDYLTELLQSKAVGLPFDGEVKRVKANTGSLSYVPFGGASFAMASTGSSIFCLSSQSASSTASSTAKSQSDSTASGFVLGVQSSDFGSGAITVSQNSPFQFGSSVSPVFGTSGVSFTSSSPLFSSCTLATNMFGSGASFVLSPSTSFAETKSVDSGSGPSSGIFSFGPGASAASSGANAFSLSSGTSNTFSFGVSSLATSSLTRTAGSNSITTPTIFSFGASSSSGTSMIGSCAGNNSGIFGASTLAPSSETNAASSSSATFVPFGSGWQTPNSSLFGATSSSPLHVFSFGASCSSFTAGNNVPMVFGSSTAASAGPVFSFSTTSATTFLLPLPFTIPSMFGNFTAFTASGNNDQTSMKDSMAEDVQATTPAVPVFGQQSSPGRFAFGSAVPQSISPFRFSGQRSQGAVQNSPFQATSILELINAGGSFLLGSGGPGDKSNRRIVKFARPGKPRKR